MLDDYFLKTPGCRAPEQRVWHKLCKVLATCELRELQLRIHIYFTNEELTAELSSFKPWSLQDLLKIWQLDSLQVWWEYRVDELRCMKRILTATQAMRQTMLEDASRGSRETGYRLRLRYDDSGDRYYRENVTYISFEMAIDSHGRSLL
jgi:hypothetical protein